MSPTLASITTFIQSAFGPLISVFQAIMVFFHDNITGGSWGLAIIGLTIVVRAALVPLTVKQISSMMKMQALGPQLKALQVQYKGDKQRLNEETMKFYRENEVNPLASCLPLVLQFPVFISLYYMLRSDLKLQICGHALHAKFPGHLLTTSLLEKTSCQSVLPGSGKFLFIPDVTAGATGGVLAILIVLYIGSQLISSLLTTATVDRNQRLIALGLPFLFTFFIISFPAGLIVYWITTNIWTMGQQFTVRRYFPAPGQAAAKGLGLAALWPGASNRGSGPGVAASVTSGGVAAGGKQNGRNGRSAAGREAAVAESAERKSATAPAGAAKGSGRASAAVPTPKRGEKTPTRTRGGEGAQAVAPGAKGGEATRAGTRGTKRGESAPARPTKGKLPDAPAKGDGSAASARAAKPPGGAPPPPPRKKKKRSGRRR